VLWRWKELDEKLEGATNAPTVPSSTPPSSLRCSYFCQWKRYREQLTAYSSHRGGNMILTYDGSFTSTGTFVGTCSGQEVTVVHPDGTTNTRATCTFTGTVGDKSGTLMFLTVAQGQGSSFHGHFTLLAGGTGGLANLRGEGSFSGAATGPLTSAGTYTGHVNSHRRVDPQPRSFFSVHLSNRRPC